MARATAQAVNCLEPVADSPQRPSWRSTRAASAAPAIASRAACTSTSSTLEPDDRASIKIDVVRDVLEQDRRSGRSRARRRVVLIREADTLEPAAQNSLLKSLEEPPPGTMFILTTAVPGALLPTVRSRCMRLRFGRLTSAEVAAGADARSRSYSDAEAREAAPLADGSIGQALALVDNDLSMFRELAMGLLQQTAGRADTQSRVQAASALHTGGSKKERTREDVAIVLRLMASMLRDLEAINAGADRAVLANPLLDRRSRSAGARLSPAIAPATAFGAVDRALTALERNAGTKVVTEWLAVQM